MLNLTTPTLESTRWFISDSLNLSTGELYLSLAAIHITLLLFLYNRFWRVKASSESENNARESRAKENGHYVSAVDDKHKHVFSNVKVTKLLIHPIKSCRGTSVLEAQYTEEGLENDRKLAIIDAESHKVITAREKPQMVLIHPRVDVDRQDEHGGRIHVSFPEDTGCKAFTIPLNPTAKLLRTWKKLEDVELWGRSDIDGYICQTIETEDRDAPTRILSTFLGKDVYLVLKGPRPRPCPPTTEFPILKASTFYQDGYPLLVASEESLVDVQTQLRGEVGNQGVADNWGTDTLVMERFRPNIVLAGAGVPWAEDAWETIRIGENASTITLVSKCTRCLLPNVDPETGVRDKAVPYKVLMKFRTGKNPQRLSKPCFGCNGVPSGGGVIRVGDCVSVVKIIQ